MHDFQPTLREGQLVRLVFAHQDFEIVPFATVLGHSTQVARICEFINLETYPSWNDFTGNESLIYEGDVASIIRFVGRPLRINHQEVWSLFDVYEILFRGAKRQVFRCNLQMAT